MGVGDHTFFNAILMRPLEVRVFVSFVHALGALVVVVFEADALGGFGTFYGIGGRVSL